MAFFNVNSLIGNPFSTPIGQKIEQATEKDVEDVSLNIEICDMINESDDGPRDAIKAIRKRLTQNAAKSAQIVMQTLTVLEMCVKNCGHRFHVLSCQKDFIQELVKLIGPKNEPPVELQDRVLRLIQEWADTFNEQPNLSGVLQVYHELLQKGIEFPPKNLNSMVPILTPKPTCYDQPIKNTRITKKSLNPEQRAKLLSELDVVQTNVSILSEMLNESNSNEENSNDVHLMKELVKTCTEMQSRIVLLIEQLNNDEITAELLRINDDLNNAFLRYSRWSKKLINREDINIGDSTINNTESLIDFGASTSTSKNHNLESLDDFDKFIEDRKIKKTTDVNDENEQTINLNEDEEQQFKEIAAWLQDNKISSDATVSIANSRVGSAVTSSEFDKFLAERAAVVEKENQKNAPAHNITKE